jgi:type IX secretion system PorP/SprF family membrane protein
MNSVNIPYMLNRIFIAIGLTLFCIPAVAQQMPHYSQYYLNDFVINPAIAGTRDYYDVRVNNRSQWVGITDAPRTFTLSLHSPLKKKNMGLGGTIFTDITGPTRRIGINGSYSYHLRVSENTQLSMGLSAGIMQFAIDASKVTVRDQGDMYFTSGVQSAIVPDFAFGLYLYNKKYFVGASAPQINQSRLKLVKDAETSARLEDHYFVTGGYTFDLNEEFQIQPVILAKYVAPTPIMVDISSRVIYKENLWLGLTYRTRDALSFAFGFLYQEQLMFGYSYDHTVSGLQKYSSGTHEVMIGIRFGGSVGHQSAPSIE